jgi:GntR family transcriptional regulator
MFKRSPSLVQQVKTHLKRRIVNAEFESGRIPPESDLADELGVSRNTIRDALSQLETEGVVIRRQGAGTFINQAGLMVKTRLEEIVPYEQMIRDHGFSPTVQLVDVREKKVDPDLVSELDVAADEKLLVVEKLFLADEKPVIFSRTFVPPRIITVDYATDDLHSPIYEFVPDYCQQEFAYYVTEIVPVVAASWLANRLALPSDVTTLICFEEVGYNQADEPIVKAYSYFRSDLLRLRLIRRNLG